MEALMADSKRKRPRSRGARAWTRIQEVKGKIVEAIEIDPDVTGVAIIFNDNTALNFDLEPTVMVSTALYNRGGKGSWRTLKKWPTVRSKTGMAE
jgi:hypothetical protein